MPVLPKPEDERRRRNAVPTITVDAAGYNGPPPEPTVELGELARKFYDRAWQSPAAGAWLDAEADVVAEWAGLKAVVARQLREGEAPQSALLAQIKAREDALLMSPRARLAAHLKVVEDDSVKLELADVEHLDPDVDPRFA